MVLPAAQPTVPINAQSGPPSSAKHLCAVVALPAAQPHHISTFIAYAKEKRATAMASPRDGVGGRLAASRFGASCCCSTRCAIWRLATWRCRGANVVASVAPYVAVAAVPFGRCPSPSHRHRLVDCWICLFRRCGPPIPMHAPRSESRLVFRPGCCAASSSSYFDAIALPRLVLAVPACRRVSSSSHRLFFKSSSSRRSPRVGKNHCLGRPCH